MSDTQYTELWSSLSEKSRHIETGMDALTRKRTGSYYTDLKLTDVMMSELVELVVINGFHPRRYGYLQILPYHY